VVDVDALLLASDVCLVCHLGGFARTPLLQTIKTQEKQSSFRKPVFLTFLSTSRQQKLLP